MFSLCSRFVVSGGGESGGMKALISFVMQVMFGWCHVSSCWEISMAEQAGGPNVPITQRCDYPVCLCSDGCVLACVLTGRKACLSVCIAFTLNHSVSTLLYNLSTC